MAMGTPFGAANVWRPELGTGGAERSTEELGPRGQGAHRPTYAGLSVNPRRLYSPSSGYWSHRLPLTSSYAIASHGGQIGMIVASVMINGKGPFRFMLDTGATRTVLSSATAAKLALQSSPGDRILVQGVSGLSAVPLVHVDSVTSGSLQISGVSAPVLSGPVLDGVDGILGMDGLSGMRLTADFVRDQVFINNSSGDSQPALYAVRGRFVSQRLLLVQGHINGIATAAVIDTGATHSLGNEALLTALVRGHQPVVYSTKDGVVDATNTQQPGALRRIPELQFGDAAITNLQVTFGDYAVFNTWGLRGKPALLLGMDVLGTLADFSIDYRRAELQVLPWPNS
ncbi:MAG TPA: retroviral-like aspartic protease family protein [Steroidobacteraceae bacterium]|jgi:predicted aspartyl protease|nr:retroviral-like aspartic protease family protein [Steroidobacteraceae bacterium]